MKKGKERKEKEKEKGKVEDRTRVIKIRCKITELQAHYTVNLLNLSTKVGVST